MKLSLKSPYFACICPFMLSFELSLYWSMQLKTNIQNSTQDGNFFFHNSYFEKITHKKWKPHTHTQNSRYCVQTHNSQKKSKQRHKWFLNNDINTKKTTLETHIWTLMKNLTKHVHWICHFVSFKLHKTCSRYTWNPCKAKKNKK